MKKFDPSYLLPGVIGVYYVIHSIYYGKGLQYSGWLDILVSTILILVYSHLILLLIARNKTPASVLIASLIIVVTLFYGSFRDAFFSNLTAATFVRDHLLNKTNSVFIILLFVITWMLVRIIKSKSGKLANVGTYAIIFTVSLMCMDIGVYYYQGLPVLKDPSSALSDTIHIRGEKPDVYFIILDSKTSSKSLRHYWQFNNDSVEQALVQRGFFIEKEGRSNYNFTPYSIASTLNMSYLTGYSAEMPDEEFPQTIKAGVFNVFTNNGYAVHNLSFFDINEYPRLGSVWQFHVWDKTLFYSLFDRITNYTFRSFQQHQRELMKITYDSLLALINEDTRAPKFVYAHFFVPHPPAFIDENGNDLSVGSMEMQNMSGYLGQVVYSYKLLLGLVEKIQHKTQGKAIIAVQGDHGYRYLEGQQKMDEQFDVFKAVYFPNKDYTLFNDSISSVNTFRIIFNSQFGMKLPFLKDTSYNVIAGLLKQFR